MPQMPQNNFIPLNRVGFDLDGVLYNWDRVAIETLRQFAGITNLYYPSFDWNYIENSISVTQWKWLWDPKTVQQYSIFFNPSAEKKLLNVTYPSNYQEFLNAKLLIDALLVRKISTCAITSRPRLDPVITQTYSWIGASNLLFDSVHILGPEQKKYQVPCDIYIDDNPEILCSISRDWLAKADRRMPLLLLFDCSHNKYFDTSAERFVPIYRCRTWQVVTNYINDYYRTSISLNED